jgi:hypothetical protein
MKNMIIKTASPWRKLFPLVQKIRHGHARFTERTSKRLVISGGKIFLGRGIKFPGGYRAVLFHHVVLEQAGSL